MSETTITRFDIRSSQWPSVLAGGEATVPVISRIYLSSTQSIALNMEHIRNGYHNVQIVETSAERPMNVTSGVPSARSYPKMYGFLGYLAFAFIGGGILATAIKPSEFTQLGVPAGFTLWGILAYLIRKSDSRRLND